MYELKCSKCDCVKTYTNKRSWYNAKRKQSQCQPCQNKQASEYFSGKKNPNYPKTRRVRNTKSEYFRNCPSCEDIIYYGTQTHLNQAIVKETVCDSCCAVKYQKGLVKGLTKDQTRQMRATKAGYDNWEQYTTHYPKKKAYITQVHNLTRKQPLHLLENYDKLQKNTGVMGTEGAYQIDHIKSIDKCWKDGTTAQECSDLSNLQIITWEDNLRKSHRC